MNTKQLQIVTYEQAKRLKQLGFDWKVNHFISHEDMNPDGEHSEIKLGDRLFDYNHFSDTFSAPTVALALKWIRDEKGIKYTLVGYMQFGEGCYIHSIDWQNDRHKTYEAAEKTLLDALLTVLEKEKEQ
jgi:hypothetical protein